MLRRVLDLRPGEGRLVAPAMAVATLVHGAQLLAMIASDTAFVTAFDLGALSGFIVVAAVARVAFTLAYGTLSRRWHGGRGEGVALSLVGIATAALGLLLRAHSRPLVYLACAALLVVPAAASEAVTVATESFPARQGKRLVPLVAASSTLGALLAGATARLLAVRIGAPSLLVLAGALLVAGGAVSRRAAAGAGRGGSPDRAEGGLSVVADDLRSLPIVRVALALSLLVATMSGLSDFAFKATLKASFGRDQMAAFVGVFEAALSASVMATQLLLTARLTGRLGIRATLQLPAALVALIAPAFAFSPRVGTAAATRFAESLGRFALVTPLRSLLIAPLEGGPRARASLLVRGLAVPLGGVLAGVALGAFGKAGPPPPVLAGMLVGTACVTLLVLAGARGAYTQALARSLGEGRLPLDVTPAEAAALRSGLRALLREAAAAGDAVGATRALTMLGRDASREDVETILARAPATGDPAQERRLLASARRVGARVEAARVEHALKVAASDPSAGPALRLEALAALGEPGREQLLEALGQGLASPQRHVFAAAAASLTLVDASPFLPPLVEQLVRGPHAGPAGRALALAGAAAVSPLLDALPRAPARVVLSLSRLGPGACVAVLDRWESLDHRARGAAGRALAVMPESWRSAIGQEPVARAMEATLAAGEALARIPRAEDSRLLARELGLRVTAAAELAVDLGSIVGDRPRIAKARAALTREGRARADALELLEEVLPRAFARRTLAILEEEGPGPDSERGEALEGWLETCARYDRDELPSAAVKALLDRLVVLAGSPLFSGMTSEDLYPVGEIASLVELEPGEPAIRQGEPGDALYVVESGTLEVIRDGRKLKEVGRGAVFGEMALLDGAPRSASVTACTHARVLRIPRAEFDALLDEYPEVARGIIRTLIAHLRGAG